MDGANLVIHVPSRRIEGSERGKHLMPYEIEELLILKKNHMNYGEYIRIRICSLCRTNNFI